MKLTPKQQRFVEEYLIDLNATQAYLRAGYKAKNENIAGVEAFKLLRNPKIELSIKKAMDDRSERTKIKADDVIRELAHIAFDDIKNYLDFYPSEDAKFGVNIDIKDSKTIDTRNVSEVSIGKDGFKFKLYCKDNALVNLGKHLGLFDERKELLELKREEMELKRLEIEQKNKPPEQPNISVYIDALKGEMKEVFDDE